VAIEQGDYSAAAALHQESLAIMEELGDRVSIAHSLYNLARVASAQSDYSAARVLLEKSLVHRRELGDRMGIADTLNSLGNIAFEKGDYSTAGEAHQESLAIRRELGERGGIAAAQNDLGNVAFEQGDYLAANALYEESLAIQHELRDRRGIAFSLEGRAALFAALCRSLLAARIWGAAERLRQEIGSPLPPNERPRYDRRVAAASAVVKDYGAFNRAWQEGRALTLEQAIELALDKTAERG